MGTVVPEISLTPTKTCPVLGLGTFTFYERTGSDDVMTDAVKVAISLGYRHFDCAHAYLNEEAVGKGINAKIEDGTVRREDIFITTKLWNTNHNPDHIKDYIRKSLDDFRCDYVDLLLMHYPVAFKDGENPFPKDDNGKMIFADHDYVDTWKGMEELVDADLVKLIGISNFNTSQISRLLQNCRIKPAVLQIEVHPYFSNQKLLDFCSQHDIVVTAFSPFGNPGRLEKEKGEPNILEDRLLKDIAVKKKKTVAQICLRFLIQKNMMVIPKSVSPSRMKENIEIFDFELNPDEMNLISSLDRGLRFLKEEIAYGHKYYPFIDDE